MHHIYHTEAFVLKCIDTGEDSRILVLYTKELGLVYVRAQGIRKLSSRLRYILQEGSYASVDLVRGKEMWKLTTATLSHVSHIQKDVATEDIFNRIGRLVIRLCTGEEPNEELFTILSRTKLLLTHTKEEDRKRVELLQVAKVLTALGYLSRTLVQEGEENTDVAYQHELVRSINQALSESHL